MDETAELTDIPLELLRLREVECPLGKSVLIYIEDFEIV